MDLRSGSALPLNKAALVPRRSARSPSPSHSNKDDEINFATTKVSRIKYYRSPSPTTEYQEGPSQAECESTQKENVEESTSHQSNKAMSVESAYLIKLLQRGSVLTIISTKGGC